MYFNLYALSSILYFTSSDSLSELILEHAIKKRCSGSLKSVLDFLAAFFENTVSEVRSVSIYAGY